MIIVGSQYHNNIDILPIPRPLCVPLAWDILATREILECKKTVPGVGG